MPHKVYKLAPSMASASEQESTTRYQYPDTGHIVACGQAAPLSISKVCTHASAHVHALTTGLTAGQSSACLGPWP